MSILLTTEDSRKLLTICAGIDASQINKLLCVDRSGRASATSSGLTSIVSDEKQSEFEKFLKDISDRNGGSITKTQVCNYWTSNIVPALTKLGFVYGKQAGNNPLNKTYTKEDNIPAILNELMSDEEKLIKSANDILAGLSGVSLSGVSVKLDDALIASANDILAMLSRKEVPEPVPVPEPEPVPGPVASSKSGSPSEQTTNSNGSILIKNNDKIIASLTMFSTEGDMNVSTSMSGSTSGVGSEKEGKALSPSTENVEQITSEVVENVKTPPRQPPVNFYELKTRILELLNAITNSSKSSTQPRTPSPSPSPSPLIDSANEILNRSGSISPTNIIDALIQSANKILRQSSSINCGDTTQFYKNRADGNCLFDAFAQIYVKGDMNKDNRDAIFISDLLRKILAAAYKIAELEANDKFRKDYTIPNFVTDAGTKYNIYPTGDPLYSGHISKNATYGGDNDLILLSKLLGLNVVNINMSTSDGQNITYEAYERPGLTPYEESEVYTFCNYDFRGDSKERIAKLQSMNNPEKIDILEYTSIVGGNHWVLKVNKLQRNAINDISKAAKKIGYQLTVTDNTELNDIFLNYQIESMP